MDDLLYQNTIYFKNEILPYTFLLEGKDFVLIIKSNEQDFAHLVGKQHSKNINISQMKVKDFFKKALISKISYNDLIDFDTESYRQEYNWIKTKNDLFIELFSSFINIPQLKMYIKSSEGNYSKIDMDYFHQKDGIKISILGIIGNTTKNQFSFNSILGNDDLLENRFNTSQAIFIKKNHRVLNKDLEKELSRLKLNIKSSPRNICLKNKHRNQQKRELSNKDIKSINKLLKSISIMRGENGKKSIKIIKDDKVIEKGIKLDLILLDTPEKIADYINKNYR